MFLIILCVAASFITQPSKGEEDDSDSAATSLSNNIRNHSTCKSIHPHRIRFGNRQGSITQESTTESKEGSRMTTPDSLEWDFIDSSIPTIDQETEQLIAEIERLTTNALQETGQYRTTDSEDYDDNNKWSITQQT